MLLDLNLPGMSGIETCRAVRAISDVPIIIVSARSSDKDKKEAAEAGANAYLTKPFTIQRLLEHIARLRGK